MTNKSSPVLAQKTIQLPIVKPIKKFVVTGGAGFIGSWVSQALVDAGHSVTVLDNLSTGFTRNIPVACKFIECDFSDSRVLSTVLPECDGVFHLAAYIDLVGSFEEIQKCCELNITKSVALLEAVVKHNVPKIVFSSSAAVYRTTRDGVTREDPTSPYGSSKLFFEQILEQFSGSTGLSATCLRYFNVFGGRQSLKSKYAAVIPKFLAQAKGGKALTVFGDGSQRRDFIHVSDIASANVAAMEHFPGFVRADVGHGKSYSILDLAKALEEVFGKKLEIEAHPRPAVDADDSVAGSSELMKYWKPKLSLAEGLAEAKTWFEAELSQ